MLFNSKGSLYISKQCSVFPFQFAWQKNSEIRKGVVEKKIPREVQQHRDVLAKVLLNSFILGRAFCSVKMQLLIKVSTNETFYKCKKICKGDMI